jgi:hypothetical protein
MVSALSGRERAWLALGAVGFFASALAAPENEVGVPFMWTSGVCGAVATHLILKCIKGGPLELEDMCH